MEEPQNLQTLIARVNEIRRNHPALQTNRSLHFHATDQPFLLCYSKTDAEKKDVDSGRRESRTIRTRRRDRYIWILPTLGLQPDQSFVVHDLLTDQQLPLDRRQKLYSAGCRTVRTSSILRRKRALRAESASPRKALSKDDILDRDTYERHPQEQR